MPINDVTLSGGMRSTLSSLQLLTALQARTTERMSSGKRVNGPTDDPSAYFAAQDHLGQANDLASRKAEMSEAIQTITAANEGVKAITALIEQAKGLVAAARSAGATDRATLATQYTALLTQIDQLAGDADYKGTNLLASGSSLTVSFNSDGSSSLTVTGFAATSTGLSIAAAAGTWTSDANIDAAADDLSAALTTLRTNAASLSSNNGTIQARAAFTDAMINALTVGADQLTAADPNEEGANMLALQTRQQLSIAALGLANQAQQGILRLF